MSIKSLDYDLFNGILYQQVKVNPVYQKIMVSLFDEEDSEIRQDFYICCKEKKMMVACLEFFISIITLFHFIHCYDPTQGEGSDKMGLAYRLISYIKDGVNTPTHLFLTVLLVPFYIGTLIRAI